MPVSFPKTYNRALIALIVIIAIPVAMLTSNGFTSNHTLTISKPISGENIRTENATYPIKERWTNAMTKVKMTADANITVQTNSLAEYWLLGDANYDLLSTVCIVSSLLFTFCSMLGSDTIEYFKVGRLFFILTFWIHFGTSAYTQHWFKTHQPDLIHSGYRLLFANDLFNIDENHLIKRFAILILTVSVINMNRRRKGIAPAETRPALKVIKREELQDVG